MKLYGKSKSDLEIKDFVKNYVDGVKKSKKGRYHDILSLFPNKASLKLTEKFFKSLIEDDVPQDVIEKLKKIQNRSIEGKEEFMKIVEENIGSKQTFMYKDKIIKHIEVEKALDYGCGWGHFSIALQEKEFFTTGIDISKNEIDICDLVWGKINNVVFKNAKITDYADAEFDYVLSNQVIEHVHNVGNYLSNINRTLKIGGHLVIALPNIMNPRFFLSLLAKNRIEKFKEISHDTLNNYDKTHDHINSWDPGIFVKLVSSVGFLLEEYIPMEGIPLPFKPPFAYIYTRNKRLKNLCYTMAFKFRKIDDKVIGNED